MVTIQGIRERITHVGPSTRRCAYACTPPNVLNIPAGLDSIRSIWIYPLSAGDETINIGSARFSPIHCLPLKKRDCPATGDADADNELSIRIQPPNI